MVRVLTHAEWQAGWRRCATGLIPQLQCSYTWAELGNIRFEWDERKNAQNRRKHGVSFEEAQSVFHDEFALLVPDPAGARSEERFVLLGLSSMLRILVVCHCVRSAGDRIRIISARKANRSEQDVYRHRLER